MFSKTLLEVVACAVFLLPFAIASRCLADSDLGNQYIYVKEYETSILSGDMYVERVLVRNRGDGSQVFEFIATEVSSQSASRWEVFAARFTDGFSLDVYSGGYWKYSFSLHGVETGHPVLTLATDYAVESIDALEIPSEVPAFAALVDSTSTERDLVTAVFESVADEGEQQSTGGVSENCVADCYSENPPWPLPGIDCTDPGSPSYSGFFCCKRNADIALCISLNCTCPGSGQPEYYTNRALSVWFAVVFICAEVHLQS